MILITNNQRDQLIRMLALLPQIESNSSRVRETIRKSKILRRKLAERPEISTEEFKKLEIERRTDNGEERQ
ncbi:MAG: hypothetical protein IJD91_08100 [Clostridia bacterium]|nr:hypothetical protein [Clostridia bacterium]